MGFYRAAAHQQHICALSGYTVLRMAESLPLRCVSAAALCRMGDLAGTIRRLLAGVVLLSFWLLCHHRHGLLPSFSAPYPWRGVHRHLFSHLWLCGSRGKRFVLCPSCWPWPWQFLLGPAQVFRGFRHDSDSAGKPDPGSEYGSAPVSSAVRKQSCCSLCFHLR